MLNPDRKDGLLDWFAKRIGSACLSDLKQPEQWEHLLHILVEAPDGAWPLETWREAASYITGEELPLTGEQELRDLLGRRLKAG